MLIWSVVHNAMRNNNNDLRKVFQKCFAGTDYTANEIYSLRGTLDLADVSFYAAPGVNGASLLGAEDATVIFHADKMDTTMGQHQGLHAGLLYNPTGGVNAENFTLQGIIANLDGNQSGALISGTLNGGGTFKNLTLENLWVRDFNKTTEGDGLLIARIAAGTGKQDNTVNVSFDGISMTGYSYTGIGKKAAAALVGEAGDPNATNLNLQFRNMQIADDADNSQASPKHNGDVLAYASFLYNYSFATNTDQNIGRGLYLFSETEAKAKVTWGKELDATTEYWVYEGDDPHKRIFVQNTVLENNVKNGYYKPYVYQTQEIEVNPKTGDLNKGCGTYEDPYIIGSVPQFLTLYRYLSTKDGENEDFFKNWKVNKRNAGTDFCDKTEKTHATYTYGTNGFPTRDELSRAYYQLSADIDLSGINSGNYKVIADSFVGFGTSDRPFIGVWYGKGSDGTIHKITLPTKTSAQTYATYGFLQYAKGAVVKDMEIAIPGEKVNNYTTIQRLGAAGGVIGCILGGDNIIDNVKVTGSLALEYFYKVNNNYRYMAAVGGYVGVVKKGGLILRNVTLSDDLKDFTLREKEKGNSIDSQNYIAYYGGALCGRVEDGYVLYEGAADKSLPLWEKDTKAGTGDWVLIPDYNIVNGSYLTQQLSGASQVTVTAPDADGKLTVTLPNAAALQVMSMAMSSDALNTMLNQTKSTCGYTEKSRSRKASYNQIGCSSQVEDYTAATKYDDQVTYPYLYSYLGINRDNYKTYLIGNVSILNPIGKVENKVYHTTWQLMADGTYDMKAFGQAFRGIGALYAATDKQCSTLRGNFDGQGSTISYALKTLRLDYSNSTISPDSLNRRGLFNSIYGYQDTNCYETNGFNIQNLKLQASVNADFKDKAGSQVCALESSGILAGYTNAARLSIQNITLLEETKITTGSQTRKADNIYCGGLIGYASGSQNITMSNCKIAGTVGKPVCLDTPGYAGGFIGYANLDNNCTLKIENTIEAPCVTGLKLTSKNQVAGGLVGFIPEKNITLEIKGRQNAPLVMQDSTIEARWQAGGIIGETRNNVRLVVDYITVSDIGLSSYKAAGGIIGEYGKYTSTVESSLKNIKITDVTVREASTKDAATYDSANGQGGVVGKCRGYLTLENITVGTADKTDSKSCTITSSDNRRNDADGREHGVGGLVGAVEKSDGRLTLKNCTVSDVTVTAGKGNAASSNMNFPASAGGAVGYSNGTILLAGAVTTENVTVSTYTDRAALGDKTREQVRNFAAGGFIGCLRGQLTGVSGNTAAYTDYLLAKNNTVTGMYAGGIAGYVGSYGTTALPIRLQGKADTSLVEGGTVTGGQAAGGLFGKLEKSLGSLYLNPEQGTTPLVVSGVTISGMDAGGLVGTVKEAKGARLENVQVKNCSITASIPKNNNTLVAGGSAAGGLFGSCSLATGQTLKLYDLELTGNTILYQTETDTLQDKETSSNTENFISVGGLIGTVRSNAQGQVLADHIVLDAANQVGVRKAVGGTVQLIRKDGTPYKLADLTAPTGATNQDALNNLAETYGSFVGTLIGTVNTTQASIDMMHVWTSKDCYEIPRLSQTNLPVVDVGRTGSQNVYSYRQSCHILYGDENSDTAQGNIARMKHEVENSSATYANSTAVSTLLGCYRLNQVGDWNDANMPQKPEEIWQEVYPLKVEAEGTEKELPIFACKPGTRSLNETITALSDIMTNVSGLSSSKIDILTVTATPKKWEVAKTDDINYNGSPADSGVKAHIAVTGTKGSGYSFGYLTGTDGTTTDLFDQYDATAGTVTYTELTYTYQWTDGDGSRDHKRVFVLPVFVEEPLQVGVSMSIQAGRVQSVDTIGTNAQDSVVMANDSDSTLLLEYTFGNARKSYDMTMPKELWLTNGSGDAEKPLKYTPGTRLLLIDVTGGNKAYYYTVDATTGERIPFTAFKDSAGNSYEEKKINRADFEGTEQFLLQTILSDTKKASAENTKYDIHTGICKPEPDVLAKMQGELEAKLGVDSIPGIKITLDTAGGATDVTGELTANGELTYTMQFSITGEQAYWQKKGTIDSANNGKYLDLFCYLMNEKETERISLPAGTNFQYRIQEGSYSALQIIPDQSGVYYYKAIRERYGVTDSKFLIRDVNADGNAIGVKENTTISLQVKLKLPTELSGFNDSYYKACIDLLRTDDPDYPSGYEDALGTYRKSLGANIVPDIGFAVRVEEKDWEKLGINTYESLDQTYEIPFKVLLDFEDILRYASGDELVQQWADKDYCITYDLFGKAKDSTYGTSPFVDGPMFQDPAGNTIGETMKIMMDGGSNIWKWDGNAYTEVAEGNTAESEMGKLVMKYRFTKEQLEDTVKGTPITLTGKVLVNGTALRQLSSKEDFEKYLTNYRMNASLRITEATDALPTGNVDTYDYFVYTITRLKTDM